MIWDTETGEGRGAECTAQGEQEEREGAAGSRRKGPAKTSQRLGSWAFSRRQHRLLLLIRGGLQTHRRSAARAWVPSYPKFRNVKRGEERREEETRRGVRGVRGEERRGEKKRTS